MDQTELLANYSLVSNNRALEIFQEVNNQGGGGVGNFLRDGGFIMCSMLYAS